MDRRINICGLKFSDGNLEGIAERAVTLLSTEGQYMIFPANVDSIMLSEKDSLLAKIYNESALLLADGMPVVWASKILGTSLEEKVSGPDFLPVFLKKIAATDSSVFLLGGKVGIAHKAAAQIKEKMNNLNVAGVMHGFFEKGGSENEEVLKMINESGASVLVVAFGTPLQEKWIYENLPRLNVRLAVGVGAAIDFISGNKQRAPRWMSNYGIEWVHRLFNEPSRLWKRYILRDTIFPFLILKYRFKR